jgi:hypothetical protein
MRIGAILAIGLVWLVAPVADAQTDPAHTSGYFVEVHAGATMDAPSVGAQKFIPNADWSCDLPTIQLPSGPLVNPGRIRIADDPGAAGGPGHVGRQCETVQVAWFKSLPAGSNFSGWMQTATDDGSSRRSDWMLASPSFSVVAETGPPSPPTNIRLFVVAQ